jgi:hypothetical protein
METSRPRPTFKSSPFPITAYDIRYSVIERFVDHLNRAVGFESMTRTEVMQLVLAGMQHGGSATLRPEGVEDVASLVLPDFDVELADLLAWRMYLTGRVGLATALAGVSGAYQQTPFSVKRRYSRDGFLMKRAGEGSSWQYSSLETQLDLLAGGPTEDMFERWTYATGKLYDIERHRYQALVADRYRLDSSGKSPDQMRADFLADSWQPVRDAVRTGKDKCLPPGYEAISYYSGAGTPVGLGIHCICVNAYHEQVYPLDGASLLDALEALWESKPMPPGVRVDEGVLVVGPYVSPFELPSRYPGPDGKSVVAGVNEDDEVPPGIFEEEAAIERAMVQDEDPTEEFDDVTMLDVRDGRISIGRELGLRGNVWSQRGTVFVSDEVEGILGFRIRPDEDAAWWERTVPWAMNATTARTVTESLGAAWALSNDEEDEIAARPESLLAEYGSLVRDMTAHAHPAVNKKYLARERLFHESPMLSDALLAAYPELTGLTNDERMDLAFGFWGKNDIRKSVDGKTKSPLFLAYCVTALAGIEAPVADMGNWLYVARLLRLTKQGQRVGKTEVEAWSRQALALYRKLREMSSFVESLDTMNAEAFWQHTLAEASAVPPQDAIPS